MPQNASIQVDVWDMDSGKRVEQLQQPKSEVNHDGEDSESATKSAGSILSMCQCHILRVSFNELHCHYFMLTTAGMCMTIQAFQAEAGSFLTVFSGYVFFLICKRDTPSLPPVS